ncbi:DNA cytosine methyltransferase [Paenibacillus sp. FSL L8-0708]|uniref:DNA cytosine methyltransferase n=1 Tax=Paenibacillus sp. FSL L8-0708 TaxID=2975311 RepID=UPI0030F86B8C
MIKLLSLFGGIGADIKALKNLGEKVKTIDYVEWKENRVKAYNAMNPFRYHAQDVRVWDLKPDILVHGSPCQDNSVANLNDDKGRSKLMLETLRIIREMGEWRPAVVIWENVKGATYQSKMPILNEYLLEMERMGYRNSSEVLQAMDFGIPQSRERLFCISILGGKAFDFSKLTKRPLLPIEDFLQDESEIDLEKYIVSIPSMLNRLADLATPEEIEANKSKFRYVETVESHFWTLTERPDRCPSPGVIKLSDGRYRYPTEREYWRLMGFDDMDFDLMLKEFPVKPNYRSRTLYALAGNSIVVQMLEAIFEVIISKDYGMDLTATADGQLQFIC